MSLDLIERKIADPHTLSNDTKAKIKFLDSSGLPPTLLGTYERQSQPGRGNLLCFTFPQDAGNTLGSLVLNNEEHYGRQRQLEAFVFNLVKTGQITEKSAAVIFLSIIELTQSTQLLDQNQTSNSIKKWLEGAGRCLELAIMCLEERFLSGVKALGSGSVTSNGKKIVDYEFSNCGNIFELKLSFPTDSPSGDPEVFTYSERSLNRRDIETFVTEVTDRNGFNSTEQRQAIFEAFAKMILEQLNCCINDRSMNGANTSSAIGLLDYVLARTGLDGAGACIKR